MDDVGLPQRRPRAALQAVPVFLLPAVLGLLLGELGERTAPTALLLWAEPVVLALGVYLVFALALGGRPRMAFGLTLGLILLAVGARARPEDEPGRGAPPVWASELRGCAVLPEPARSPVRLLVWTVDQDRASGLDPALIDQVQPDLVVLTGTADRGVADVLRARLGGEVMPLPADTPEASMTLAVRGAFQYCGGEQDRWIADLDGAAGGTRLVATFPEVKGVGIFPLLAVRLSGPGGLGTWGGWPERLEAAGDAIAGVADTLGARRLVLAGDLHTPRTFGRMAGTLHGAGLLGMPAPPTWPTALGPLPVLPLHALDQVWTGQGWASGGSRALRVARQPRAPVVVDLQPTAGVVGG